MHGTAVTLVDSRQLDGCGGVGASLRYFFTAEMVGAAAAAGAEETCSSAAGSEAAASAADAVGEDAAEAAGPPSMSFGDAEAAIELVSSARPEMVDELTTLAHILTADADGEVRLVAISEERVEVAAGPTAIEFEFGCGGLQVRCSSKERPAPELTSAATAAIDAGEGVYGAVQAVVEAAAAA
eukprot:TRINITY_DN32830_c0_g1_i1.p2 TRINITY_DN32830_c0_g1~~TRINITY_DN32830_c0_g1_i1.p2  ORF type:complete len:183 (+),score=65.00 TRINITY_DN32830_c0_g1_i1:995-1543(+)